MKETTIRLLTTETPDATGYSIQNNTIQIELSKEDLEKFEQDARHLGIDNLEALAHGITTMIKHGFST